jgi:hypothetical protein
VPVHNVTSVAEHWPQLPLLWQAGATKLGQGERPLEPKSPVQPEQVKVAVLQDGVALEQRVRLVGEHRPHAPLASHAGVAPPQSESEPHFAHRPLTVLQTGVAPEHCVLLVAEHWPHAPLASHAGVAPLQSESDPQPVHRPVPVLQTGVVPEHCVLLVPEH